MSGTDPASPVSRHDRQSRRDRGQHFYALLTILGLSLVTAVVLRVVSLVIPLTVLGAIVYGVCISRLGWPTKLIALLFLFAVLSLFAPASGAVYVLEILTGIVAGWWFFLSRTLPDVAVSVPEVATFIVLIALLVLGTQYVALRVRQRRSAIESGRRLWPVGQSLRIVSLFALSFVAGLACVGAVQQSGWLMNSPTPPLDYQDGGMFNRPRLHEIGTAFFDGRDEDGRFESGVVSEEGQVLHGWQTMLLPHLDKVSLYNQIHLQQNWRTPSNRNTFEQIVDEFQSRKFRDQSITAEGYAASHFAANLWVIRPGGGMTADEITDGDSHTILAGEVAENFRAWGDPFNVRDPALGLNHPEGFATPWSSGNSRLGIFLFADGHVQSIHDDVDPAIFEALGTPNAGEHVQSIHDDIDPAIFEALGTPDAGDEVGTF